MWTLQVSVHTTLSDCKVLRRSFMKCMGIFLTPTSIILAWLHFCECIPFLTWEKCNILFFTLVITEHDVQSLFCHFWCEILFNEVLVTLANISEWTFSYNLQAHWDKLKSVWNKSPATLCFWKTEKHINSDANCHRGISPTRCNNCVFILRTGFTLHVSGDNLTHHQEYICCIWPQVSRLT